VNNYQVLSIYLPTAYWLAFSQAQYTTLGQPDVPAPIRERCCSITTTGCTIQPAQYTSPT
jgi:hypothetical protein